MDLNLKGELVIVVGGGTEGVKKINSLLTQDCRILLVSEKSNAQITKYVKKNQIELKKFKVKDVKFLTKYKPILIMATTDDRKLNRKIVAQAKKMKCYAYASDDPEISDFAHPSIINIENTVQIAVSTGGKSPAMARKLKIQAEKVFKKNIKKEDIFSIKLQGIMREKVKKKLNSPLERKKFLYSILNDKIVKQLIKDGQLKNAEKQAELMLSELE